MNRGRDMARQSMVVTLHPMGRGMDGMDGRMDEYKWPQLPNGQGADDTAESRAVKMLGIHIISSYQGRSSHDIGPTTNLGHHLDHHLDKAVLIFFLSMWSFLHFSL